MSGGGAGPGGWLLLEELDGLKSDMVVRQYTWGLDLAGQAGSINSLEGAGGIGGLLAVHDPNDLNDEFDPFGDFLFTHDGNGNVVQVLNWSDPNTASAIVAKYRYDPFGNRILFDPNVAEYDQPFRFSGKQFDAETGLGYWGYRYYSSGLGRFISRDPIGEPGFRVVQRTVATTPFVPRNSIRHKGNLHGYASNVPTCRIDPLGLEDCVKCGPNITQAIADHLTAFVSQMQGNLSWFRPSGARTLGRYARSNGPAIFRAAQAAIGHSGCGQGPCAGTVTLCDLCMSGYHIDHILIMAYIAESYGVTTARSAGEYQESFWLGFWHEGGRFTGSDDEISNADLTFNEVALCLAEAMKHSDANGGATDPLIVSEICACTKKVTPQQRADIAKKPGRAPGAPTSYDNCEPCRVSVTLPGGLSLPPIDL